MAMRYKKLLFLFLLLLQAVRNLAQTTVVSGVIRDAATGQPLKNATILYRSGKGGTRSDSLGRFSLPVSAPGTRLEISMMGYDGKTITAGTDSAAKMNILLEQNIKSLAMVVVTNNKRIKYRNKNNPAVELIRKVIANKSSNRPAAFDYTTYEKYEKAEICLRDLSPEKLHRPRYRPYQFLFTHPDSLAADSSLLYPIYLEETLSNNYYKKKPPQTKQVITAEKKVDYGNLIDSKGISTYINALYADIDIYDNNITLFTNQFVSPISTVATTFYEYYIEDTIISHGQREVRLNYTPRNPDDLLLRGLLYITLDGNYSVEKATLTVSKKINLNFIKDLRITQDFERTPGGHYYLVTSDISASFSFSAKEKGIYGRKIVSYSHLVTDQPIADSIFSQTSPLVTLPDASGKTESWWSAHRHDSLSPGEASVYKNIDSLQHVHAFARVKDIANLLVSGYKEAGKFEIGPANTFYSFNPVEGFRLKFGGRSTPEFSRRWYLESYGAYGFTDHRWKYDLGIAWSFNKLSVYGYPLHYIKASYQHDVKIPGQELQFTQENSFLLSFKRGSDDKWLYNDIFRLDYVHELPNHLSYNLGFKYWVQRPAGAIYYVQPKGNAFDTVSQISTSELSAQIRWAPHEKFYQGRVYRVPFTNRYPIFTFRYIGGIKGFFGGNYSYQDLNLNIFKRFYLSPFGYTDMSVAGGYVAGKLPFPLLDILPANQSYAYSVNSYNLMNFLEFVSDHYVGINVEHHFNGFLFNKVPFLKRLKWRELITGKLLYGGVRSENDPSKDPLLMKYPMTSGLSSTYLLGSQPYFEGGIGIGNIFRFVRVDALERFSYLDHPMISRYGIRFQIKFDY